MRKIQRDTENNRGRQRIGMQPLLGALAGFGTLFGVRFLLEFAFERLFAAWALTGENIAYAPMFAQRIVYWHEDIAYIAACAAGILVGTSLARRRSRPATNDARLAGFGALAGIGGGAVFSTAALMLDSMRLEWPLGGISLSAGLLSGVIILILGCVCGEVLGKRLIFDPVRQRFGRTAAFAVMGILAVFVNLTPLGALNSVLLTLIGCVMYERGGIAASAALRAGWMIWTNLVFAWPDGSSACLYRMYTVSEVWLTGGNAGAEAGFGCTMVWMIIAAILFRRELIARVNKRRSTNG